MQNLYISKNSTQKNDFFVLNDYLEAHSELKVNNYFIKFLVQKIRVDI